MRIRWLEIAVVLAALAAACGVARGAENPEQPGATLIFWDKHPRIVAYQLGRLSNEELLALERTPEDPKFRPAYEAILSRPGMADKDRRAAAQALVQMNQGSLGGELAGALKRLDGTEAAEAGYAIGRMLVAAQVEDSVLDRIRELARDGQSAFVRESAYAVMLRNEPPELAWQLADGSGTTMELLAAVPLVSEHAQVAVLFPMAAEAAEHSPDTDIRAAAIESLPHFPGRAREAFEILAVAAGDAEVRAPAIRALLSIPAEHWAPEKSAGLAEQLAQVAGNAAPGERTSKEFLQLVQLAGALTRRMPPESGARIRDRLSELAVRTIRVGTIKHQMLYDIDRIVVERGKPVEILFENSDQMPHNLVIVEPGAVQEIGEAAERMPAEADAQGRMYVPASEKVLYATKMLQAGESERLSFVAPSTPGELRFVCTFPGHWRRMVGTIHVVEDVEAFLATLQHLPERTMTEWTLEDLAADLPKVSFGRDIEKGRKLFTDSACLQCHKLGGEGYGFGPDLTDVFARFNGDRKAVLEEILDPSKRIPEPYLNHQFELGEDETVMGIMLEEDETTVKVKTGPSDALVLVVPKSSVQARRVSELSPMPAGLLSLMNREEILDLLAFIEAGGKIAPGHEH